MKKMEFEKGSGNVFKDLGFPDANTHLLKSDIVTHIDTILRRRRWTKKKTAKALGLSQTKLSRILRGNFRDCSIEYLSRLLKILEQNVRLRKDTKFFTRTSKSQRSTKMWEIWEINEAKKESEGLEKLWNLPEPVHEESLEKNKQALYDNLLRYGKNTKMEMLIITSCTLSSTSRSNNSVRNLHFLRELSTLSNWKAVWMNKSSVSIHFVPSSTYSPYTLTYSNIEKLLTIRTDCQNSTEYLEWFVPFKNDLRSSHSPRW